MKWFPVIAVAGIIGIGIWALSGIIPGIKEIVLTIWKFIKEAAKTVAKIPGATADFLGGIFPILLLGFFGAFLGLLLWPFFGVGVGIAGAVLGGAGLIGTGFATGLVGDEKKKATGSAASGEKKQSASRPPAGFGNCTNTTINPGGGAAITVKVCKDAKGNRMFFDAKSQRWLAI